MNIIDINTWRTYIYEQLDTCSEVYASSAMLGAFVFKSKRLASDSLALWNTSMLQAKTMFSKLSPDKQLEFSRNVVIKIPFIFNRPIPLSDILTLNDTSGGSAHILGFLSCTRQAFPVYKDVVTHVRISENYIRSMFQNAFKAQFSEYVHLINGECYISGSLLAYLSLDQHSYLKHINNREINELQIYDINGEGWNACILEREGNNWCSFVINARRSVLKDFDIHANCVCSNIAAVASQELNRRNITGDQVTHLITVFDVQKTLDSLHDCLCETETLDVLTNLLV